MLWGKNKPTNDDTSKISISQPPPTPGLASWAFNSLFNKQTPSSKYAALAKKKEEKYTITEDKELLENKDDTFYNRKKNARRTNRKVANDDLGIPSSSVKNVAWGGDDIRIRTRSSSFIENTPRRKLNEDKELLPDVDNDKDFEFSRFLKRSNSSHVIPSSSLPSTLNQNNVKKSSLPQAFPGKFPSPYVSKETSSSFNSNLLSSSASKNLKAADYNTERNKNIVLDSSSPVKPLSSPLKSSYRFNPKYLPHDDDDLKVLESLDQNILELNQITQNVENLKANGAISLADYQSLEKKYESIKQELIDEFKKSKKMYDSYYAFMDKYKMLKNELKNSQSKEEITGLKSEIRALKVENRKLTQRIELDEERLKNDDTEMLNLKSTLQNSSKFESTLRRKIKYLEDKIEEKNLELKKERFQLNEKNYLLEVKLKEDEERYELELSKKQRKIEELERKLQSSKSSSSSLHDPNISLIPEYKISNDEKVDYRDDTLEYLNKKYPDRRISDAVKHSPEKYQDAADRHRRARPMSLQSNYKLSDLKDDFAFDKFDKIDESTTTYDFGRNKPTSFKPFHSNGSFPDISLNLSEI